MFKVVRVLLLGGLFGKVLGVLRELVFAWMFGTGAVASAFRLAQSAFLIPLHGFVSETINGAFTPLYAQNRSADRQKAFALFSGLYTILFFVSIIFSIFIFFGSSHWVDVLAPGFDLERRAIAINMLQVLSFALPAYVVSGLFASVDLAMGRGTLNASRASLQSLGLILGTLAASWLEMPSLIAVGFVFSFVVFFAIGAHLVNKEGLSLRWVWVLSPEVKDALISLYKIVRILIWIPIAFQVNSIIERRVASLVSPDAMAGLDYARFMTETIVVLVAMPFGVAGLSTMSNMNNEQFRRAKSVAFRALLYFGLPLSAMMYANANFIVELVFKRGAFGATSVATTSQILSGMVVGVWGQLLGYAGAKFLTARGRNKGALFSSVGSIVCSIFVLLFAQDALGVSVLGYAAAVQGVVFGFFVLWQLEVLRELSVEIFSLSTFAILSVFFVEKINVGFLYAIPMLLVYWLIVLVVLPWHRSQIILATSFLRSRIQ